MCMGVCLCVCVCVVHGMCFAHGLGGQDKRTTHAKFRTNTRTVGLSSSSSAPRSTLPSCVRIVKKLSACLPVLRWGFVQRDRQRTSGRTWGTSRPFSEVISIIVSEAKLPRVRRERANGQRFSTEGQEKKNGVNVPTKILGATALPPNTNGVSSSDEVRCAAEILATITL